MAQTKWYIDPTVDAGGAGTEADPFKGWDEVTWTDSHRYYGRGGQTSLPTAVLNVTAANIYIGSYGTGQHIIDGAGITDNTRTIRIAADNFTLDNVHVKSPITSAALTHCIQSTNTISGITVTDCIFTGQVGTAAYYGSGISFLGGAPFIFTGNTITNVNTGILIASAIQNDGVYCRIAHNTISDFVAPVAALDGDSDAISVLSSGLPVDYEGRLFIEHNTLSDFKENGIDLAGASNAIAQFNTIRDVQESNNTTAAGYIAGASDGSCSGNIFMGNTLTNMTTVGQTQVGASRTLVTAFADRGCLSGLFFSNFVYNADVFYGSYAIHGTVNTTWLCNNTLIKGLNNGVDLNATNYTYILYNNIIYDAGDYAMNVNIGSTVFYGNNYLGTQTIGGTGTPTDNGNNITTDLTTLQMWGTASAPTTPLIIVNDSALSRSGYSWTEINRYVDLNGNALPKAGIDINCLMDIDSSPFHPKNL